MSVVILSSSFKDLLLLFDLKVFDLFFVEAARCSTKEEKRRRLFSLKNSFFDFLFVCVRGVFFFGISKEKVNLFFCLFFCLSPRLYS